VSGLRPILSGHKVIGILSQGDRDYLKKKNYMITKNGPKPKTANYRKILEKKAEEVRQSMSAQKAAQVVARLDIPSDEGDLSQQHHEEWIFLNRNTIDMKLLREIAGALHRMDHDHYGVCLECEEPISAKRLDAVPWAKYCVTCQELIATRIADGEMVEFQEADK
jgi:DnaK suppressor protein